MVLGLENIKGLGGISGFDFSGLFTGIVQVLLIAFLFLFVGGIVFLIFWNKKQKQLYNKKIFWFEEVNKNMIPVGENWACELGVPNSDIRLFYVKDKNLWLPRLTKRMGKDAYWCAIKNNREIVNFVMTNINEEMKEAELEYDHTDMRYAAANMRKLIQTNFRDKSTPWWKEYKTQISIVVIVFILTVSGYFLLTKIGSLIDQLAIVAQTMAKSCYPASGVLPQ